MIQDGYFHLGTAWQAATAFQFLKLHPCLLGENINKEKYEGAVRCSLGGWYGGNVEESA